jgi:hypothetical protein
MKSTRSGAWKKAKEMIKNEGMSSFKKAKQIIDDHSKYAKTIGTTETIENVKRVGISPWDDKVVVDLKDGKWKIIDMGKNKVNVVVKE